MYFDGSKLKDGAGAGVVLISPEGCTVEYAIELHFDATNNAAEYEGFINGLRIAHELGVRYLLVYSDSDLVIRQFMSMAVCDNEDMRAYCAEVRKLEPKFPGLELRHLPRRYNDPADRLAKIGSTRVSAPAGVFVNKQYKPSAQLGPDPELPSGSASSRANDVIPDPPGPGAQVMLIDADWMAPYVDYLLRDT